MQHLEGSGTPVLYIGRTVLKGYGCFLVVVVVVVVVVVFIFNTSSSQHNVISTVTRLQVGIE